MSEQEINTTITQTVEVLSETFAPAQTLEESAKRFTSVQLAQAIYDLAGITPSVEVLYQVMLEYGYRYVVDETSASLKYVWLLKYRNH